MADQTHGGFRRGYLHIGDLLWRICRLDDPGQAIRLWESQDGNLVGWAWCVGTQFVAYQIHPQWRTDVFLQDQIVTWAMDRAVKSGYVEERDGHNFWTIALDAEVQTIDFLTQRGFTRENFHYLHMQRDLMAPIPDLPLLPGWTVRPVRGESEWPARVAAQCEVFTHWALTVDMYRWVRQAAGYTPELDLVVAGPHDVLGAFCICWFEPTSRVGEFEPVGTLPAWRGHGFGTAVMLEGLRRLKGLGAQTAILYSVGHNDVANHLYESVGFHIFGKAYLYGIRL